MYGPRFANIAARREHPSQQASKAGVLSFQVRISSTVALRTTLLHSTYLLAATCVPLLPAPALAQSCRPTDQVITTSIPGPVRSDGGSISITASAAVANSSGPGVEVLCPATTISNAGSIVGSVSELGVGEPLGMVVQDGSSVRELTNSGTISGGVSNTGSIFQLNNIGDIRGSNGGLVCCGFVNPGVSTVGIFNSGTISSFTNSGTVTGGGGTSGMRTAGGFGSAGIMNDGTMSLFTNVGIIRGGHGGSSTSSGGDGGSGIANNGNVFRFDNVGTVVGGGGGSLQGRGGTGLSNFGNISRLSNVGVISGGASFQTQFFARGGGNGISNSGYISGLQNDGTIIGGPGRNGRLGVDGGIGIENTGTIAQLINNGTISGGAYAISSHGFIPTKLVCAAERCSTLRFDRREGAIGPITNSGVIAGNIEVQDQDVTIRGGSGKIFGILRNGSLTITNGNLLFAGGNQWLQQNVSVHGGRGSVTNAGNLMLSAPQSIAGNYTQGPEGSLIIGISGADTGRLNVSEAVTLLDATVAPQLLEANGSHVPPLGQRIQVISAQGGILGRVANLGQSNSLYEVGVRFDLPLYSPNSLSVVLTPVRYAGLGAIGIPEGNAAIAVGSGLDTARPSAGSPMTQSQADLYTPLYTLSADQITPTLEQMAPVIYADVLSVNRTSFQTVSSTIAQILEARRGAPAAARSSIAAGPHDSTIWLSGIGQFLNLNSANGLPGYSGSAGGLVTGIDTIPWPDTRIGVAVGFSSQNIGAANSATYRGEAVQLQVYGSARRDIAFLDVQAGGVFTEGTAKRVVSAYNVESRGSISGAGGGGTVRGGVRIEFSEWNVEPSVTIGGLALSQGGVTEANGGPVGLQVSSSNIASLQSLVGLRMDRRVPVDETTTVVPSVQVGWAYEMLDTNARVSASFLGVPGSGFVVSNPAFGRNALVVGAQATLETGSPLQVFAGYAAALNSNATTQAITAGLKYTW